jgi:pimeloyl-ACP methyl ester carboxylesterase
MKDEITQRWRRVGKPELAERAKISDYPVVIDGKVMNLNVQGSEEPNARVVVLMPGNDETDPTENFQPLIDQLKADCRVVTITPFNEPGKPARGLSDTLDEGENRDKAEDFYTVLAGLKKQGVVAEDARYTLVPHSASGKAALMFARNHPEAVEGIVTIDAYLPGQEIPMGIKGGSTDMDINPHYPDGIPTIFLTAKNTADEAKGALHFDIAAYRESWLPKDGSGKQIILEGEHYLHNPDDENQNQNQSARIAQYIKELPIKK